MGSKISRRWRWALGLFVAFGLLLSFGLVQLGGPTKLRAELGNRAPGELIRHAKLRLQGHDKLEWLMLGPLNRLQLQYERAVPGIKLPTLGKGQQSRSLARVRYSPSGQPKDDLIALKSADTPPPQDSPTVTSAQDLAKAVSTAKAGQVIQVAPGRYTINQALATQFPGTKDQPITLRASQPGEVTLEFTTIEGITVSQPFWVFENLVIRGVCPSQQNCEHAFHVVGNAQGTIVRNNLIEDFNAHIKVNGLAGVWPDDGLVQYNTITNSKARTTQSPVTPIDIVGAHRWRLADNIISNFVKVSGSQISFGAFMKGAGRGGRMERNLVVCTPENVSQPGARVALSFGGGGTGQGFCRDGKCAYEHIDGLVANNIIAHCNDAGIDINQSVNSLVAHNTLINTAGIVVRQAPATANIYGNLLDGQIRQRQGGQMKLDMNEVTATHGAFDKPDELKLGWRVPPENIPSVAAVKTDFCSLPRADGTRPGAFADKLDCARP